MTLVTRRHFVRQTALAAAAFYGYSTEALHGASRFFEARGQKTPSLDEAAIRQLTSQITGHVITPEASDYESSRMIFNRAFDLRPALIVRCAGPSDVARALDFAQSRDLPLAVHGGGHSRIGFGMCDGGVVIDLAAMKRVELTLANA
jgi:hypothetical protein